MAKTKIPTHIGIIMDGNRRWARQHGVTSVLGHQAGYKKLKQAANWCFDEGIKILTVWAFSTENWNRSRYEVRYLMNMIKHGIRNDIGEFHEKNIRLNLIGNFSKFSKKMVHELQEAMESTKNNSRGILNVGLSYGGRMEIMDAMKEAIRQKIDPAKITEKVVNKLLYTKDIPDPDMIIRTSGEKRLSGFMPWQGAYSELMFIKKLWPDFNQSDIKAIIEEYNVRQRRFGQ